MAKNLASTVTTQLGNTEKAPVNLFIVTLDSGTLRLSATKSNVTFPTAGNVYTARAIEVSGLQQSAMGTTERVTFRFDNTDRAMASYAAVGDWQNRKIEWWRVFRDALGASANYIEMFQGLMEQPKGIGRNWMTVTAIAGKGLRRQAMPRFFGKSCGHIFGDAYCNVDGNADLSALTATSTADSGSATTLVDNALTQANDYWNFGKIKITIDGTVYWRIVSDFVAGTDTVTFDIELPEAVSNGDAYTIYKGCSKTIDACLSNQNWGPAADNYTNFGGQVHIGSPQSSDFGFGGIGGSPGGVYTR